MSKKISLARYEKAVECFEGYCTTCKKFTRGETEGDGYAYECPVCGDNSVLGVEQALLAGEITI